VRRAISIGVALGITFGTMVPASAAAPVAPLHDKWALLIGVDSFQDPSVPGNKDSANNVANLAMTLKDVNAGKFGADHVLVLTGNKATKSGIEHAIGDWLEKKALPGDLVFVYLSSASIQGPHGEPMVFSYDTLSSEPELSGLDMHALAMDLKRRIQSNNIVMVIDASPATKTAPDFTKLADLGVTVITAASGNQKSINNGALDRSLFEHHLGDSIRHGGGTLTLRQIFDYLSSTVSSDAEKAFHTSQTPALAVSKTNPATMDIALGAAVKSSYGKRTVSMGHPIDQLALSRPDLLTAQHPAPAATAAKDDDDDDDKPQKSVDFSSYMTKMKSDIQKNWKPPKGLESRRLVAVFTIARDGRILNPSIVEGSGVPALDKSALDALSAASPLDPLPPGSPRSVDIKYKFDWAVHPD
jgi:TonB family protein